MNELMEKHAVFSELIGTPRWYGPLFKLKDKILYDTEVHEMVYYFADLLK